MKNFEDSQIRHVFVFCICSKVRTRREFSKQCSLFCC